MELSILADDGDAVRVRVAGRITHDNIPASDDPLREMLGPDVYSRRMLLNLSEAEFLDSRGIGWLLVCHKRFNENSGRLVLYSIPPLVLDVIKVLRMHLVFELAESEDEALVVLKNEPA